MKSYRDGKYGVSLMLLIKAVGLEFADHFYKDRTSSLYKIGLQ